MKFAKTFESTAKTVPNEWKPFLIHYKELKRIINQIVQELESRGLPSTLLAVLSHDGMLRREYPIDGNCELYFVKYQMCNFISETSAILT